MILCILHCNVIKISILIEVSCIEEDLKWFPISYDVHKIMVCLVLMIYNAYNVVCGNSNVFPLHNRCHDVMLKAAVF